MKVTPGNLSSALGLGARDHIAIVGGGGKSTLLFALARELRQQGLKIVTTTTTKIRLWEGNQAPKTMYLPSGGPWENSLKEAVAKYGHVFVSREDLSSGKAAGIPKAAADALFQAVWVDHLLVEADGAAGRSVKVPGHHEPVIPDSATVVIAVMGLDALGSPCTEENVFRIDEFGKITGLKPQSEITPEALVKIFTHRKGLFKGSPGKARRVAFLNKMDLLEDRDGARRLMRYILQSPGQMVNRVVLGSLHKEEYMVYLGEER
jgi:probable selenium-dependent hydroxylase accessory protein YqeC